MLCTVSVGMCRIYWLTPKTSFSLSPSLSYLLVFLTALLPVLGLDISLLLRPIRSINSSPASRDPSHLRCDVSRFRRCFQLASLQRFQERRLVDWSHCAYMQDKLQSPNSSHVVRRCVPLTVGRSCNLWCASAAPTVCDVINMKYPEPVRVCMQSTARLI